MKSSPNLIIFTTIVVYVLFHPVVRATKLEVINKKVEA